MESGALVDGNYIEAPGHEGVAIFDSWNNSVGRGPLRVTNNIIVNVRSGIGHNNGIEVQSPALSGSNQVWASPMNIENNSVYLTAAPCITVSSSSLAGGTGASALNNICHSTSGGITGGSAYTTHDYNDYFNAGVSCPVSGESHSMCVDPQFVSTAAPYVDVNFKLQSGTQVQSAGFDLSSVFTNDYFGNTRATPWDMSASAMSSTTTGPNPPTALTATVN
jgi:hypothetical protein